jgi:protease PrsW
VNEFFAIFLGSAPALLWLIYFYRRDRFEPEPIRLVLKTFAWGAFGIVPAAAIEQLFSVSELAHSDPRAVSVAALTLATFAIIGPVEEGIKFLFVRLTVYRNPEFDEPVDGLIYASSAALGFAAAENITYVVGSGAGVLVGRALISTLGHVLVSAPWGLALGLRRAATGFGTRHVASGLLASALLHGGFDYLIFLRRPLSTVIFLAVLFPAMIVFARGAFRRAVPLSQYAASARCQGCLNPLRPGALFCPTCGHAVELGAWRCPTCEADCRPGAAFCGKCGRAQPKQAAASSL